MAKHIGFISTRFAGTDGVTLEVGKWAKIPLSKHDPFEFRFWPEQKSCL
jgi:hypothetical protein